FAESAADAGVGRLDVDDIGADSLDAGVLAADRRVNPVAGDCRGCVEAAHHVLVLGLLLGLAIATGAGRGEGDALAGLDQGGVGLACLDLLGATSQILGAASNDANLVASPDFATACLDLDVADIGRAVDPVAAIR